MNDHKNSPDDVHPAAGTAGPDAAESLRYLLDRYGPLLNKEALVTVLGFTSVAAFERYHQRGRLDLPLVRMPGRRGVFAHATDVATFLSDLPREEDAGIKREKEGG